VNLWSRPHWQPDDGPHGHRDRHRVSTVRDAAQLHRGAGKRWITDIGSHEELLQTSATYQKLYRLQFMILAKTTGMELRSSARKPEVPGC